MRFVYQGQKRLRKGYGNHVFASLNALLGAILTNRSAVLGLDEATRELNTPHLLWDDESVWSARSLRARYLSCACQSAKGIKNMRADAPLWHTQKQIAHLSGIAPDERWPLAVDPAGPDGLGLAKTLGSFFTRVPYRTQTVGSDCGEDRGDHFLKRGFEELASLPNVYGILAYAFSRPTDDLARFVTAQHRHNASFAIGTHVRVNLHVGTSTHGASTLVGKEKAWRMEPLKQAWANMLTQHHLPKLAQSLSESTFLFVSDQPKVAAGLSAALGRGASHFDAVAADDAMRRVTNDEKSRPFMIHSADWGNSPRWASLAELFILSTSTRAVVCSGPYSPSTFCE